MEREHEILTLLQHALQLADDQDLGLVGVRIATAIDDLTRNGRSKADDATSH